MLRYSHCFLLLSLVLILFISCSPKGDIHPDIAVLDKEVAQNDLFELEEVFEGAKVLTAKIKGPYLFVLRRNYLEDDPYTSNSCQFDILLNGKSIQSVTVAKEADLTPPMIDNSNNVYVGRFAFMAPDYKEVVKMPFIMNNNKENSLEQMKVALEGVDLKLQPLDIEKVLGEIEDESKMDSLYSAVLGHYQGDRTHIDSSYREHLFFMIKGADKIIHSINYSVIYYKGKGYFWYSSPEPDEFEEWIDKFEEDRITAYQGFFDPSTESLFGGLKYDNKWQKVSVNRFDKSIEEWEVKGGGAPHTGFAIVWPDPARIWYYEVEIDGEVKMKYKIRENDGDNRVPFNYTTTNREFYLYDLYDNKLERVKYVGDNKKPGQS